AGFPAPAPAPAPDLVPVAAYPGSNVVTAAGNARASTQQADTSVPARRPAPTSAERSRTREQTHSARQIRPGSTTGTSRREAHGWSGRIAGIHSTATVDQPMIRSSN